MRDLGRDLADDEDIVGGSAKPNPSGALPNPYTAKPNPYGALPNPYTAEPNPYGALPNPFTVKPTAPERSGVFGVT